MPLKPAHAVFVAEFLACYTAAEAARKAWPTSKDPRKNAARALLIPEVSQALSSAVKAKLEGADVRASWVVEQLRNVAASDLLDMVDEQGRFRALKDIPKAARLCIKSIKVTEYPDGRVVQELGLWDKLQALDRLGRFLKMWSEGSAQAGGELTINFLNVDPPPKRVASAVEGVAPHLQQVNEELAEYEDTE